MRRRTGSMPTRHRGSFSKKALTCRVKELSTASIGDIGLLDYLSTQASGDGPRAAIRRPPVFLRTRRVNDSLTTKRRGSDQVIATLPVDSNLSDLTKLRCRS